MTKLAAFGMSSDFSAAGQKRVIGTSLSLQLAANVRVESTQYKPRTNRVSTDVRRLTERLNQMADSTIGTLFSVPSFAS